jgi:isoleucyl-tRNA synthetase
MTLVKVAAPIMPFTTEEIYQNIRPAGSPESVHLCDYPVYHEKFRDRELERKMEIVRRTVSMGRALRAAHSLKIRQPLRAIHLVTRIPEERRILMEMEGIIREELNIKEVVFRENEEDLVEYSAKPNYRVLGKQLGKEMKLAASRIEGLSAREIQSLLEGATLSIEIGASSIDLTKESIVIARSEKENLKVLNEGSLTIALDPEVTEELKQEGLMRDIIRGIQNLRKETGLEVTDRIELSLFGSELIQDVVAGFEDRLLEETLAVGWIWQKSDSGTIIKTGDEEILVSLRKV